MDAQDAKRQLVGMSDEKILTCMGPPQAKASAGATEVWQYASGNGHTQGNVMVSGNRNFATGSVVSSSRFCNVNVAMNNHVVQSVNYAGPTGGLITEGEQCAFVVSNCLPPKQ